MQESALVITNGHFSSVFAKTTHGLVRGPSRYAIKGVIDAKYTGQDAGMVLDGQFRNIPFFESVASALHTLDNKPSHCLVGVATVGGKLPASLRADLIVAAKAGLMLVNGLHQLLSQDPEVAPLASGGIVDLRKPKPASELRFWSGEVLSIPSPRIAVLGMDCAIGKRTTAMMIRDACRKRGMHAEMIYTGQTGWLQGLKHGFIFDATLNDFVSGELEKAILACYRDTQPDLILLEGQSSLRNPAGPAGSEFICSGGAQGVILQHAPQREYFEDFEDVKCCIPPIEEEIELIRLLGADVWAITLFTRGVADHQSKSAALRIQETCGITTVRTFEDGIEPVVDVIRTQIAA